MNTITFIAIIAVIWVAHELVIGFYVWHSRKRFKHELRVERTQQHFATARNELMRLAIANEVDVNSVSFKQFYCINTLLMRRPDQYTDFSAAIASVFIRGEGTEPDLRLVKESGSWSPAFKHVVRATANAMDYIVLDYSWLIRLMFRLERSRRPNSTPIRMLQRLSSSVEKEKPISEIRRTQRAMYRMAETNA